MLSKISKSPKTIQKRGFSQWIFTLKSGLTHCPLIFFLLFSVTNFSSKTFGQAANLDQIRNGSATARISPADWVNGNAGPSNAHYAEGYSIPYRMHVTGLTTGSHVLKIEWDTKDQNGHAIDYITHYDNMDNPPGSHQATFGHAAETISPTLGIAGLGALTTFAIPAPSSTGSEVAGQPTASFNALPASLRLMSIYGGTITAMSYDFQEAPDAVDASTTTRLSITFSTTNTQVLFAWGGHIAAEYDWGAGRGATGVNGSPYHTRLISIDGSGGNQDRSLKASAVIIPPPLCGISAAQFACPETASLTFDATGSSTGLGISYVWTINNGNTAGAQISGSNTGFSVTVVPIGTDFIAGGTFNLSLTVNKTGAQSTTCTRIPAGTIVKVIATASADPVNIDITSAAHNTTLTADIDPTSTDPNNANYTYQWSIVTLGTAGTLTNATSRIATYTTGVADASTTIEFKVIATQIAAPNCADDALVSVNVGTGPNCDVTPQATVCQGATPTHTGSTKISTNTFTWSLEANGGGGSTNSTLLSANGGTTMQVNAVESYRIVLTQTFDNPAFNTSCFEDVTVVPTPTVSAIYNPPGCTENTFSIDVPNSVVGSSYRVTQGGEVTPTYDQTKAGDGGTLNFSGLAAGGGFLVRVTTGTASCTATTDCASSTNSCNSNAARGVSTPVTSIVKPVDKLAETYKIILESPTKVKAVPNPFTDKIRFNLVSGVSGYGSLELYNILGQKVGVVYQGFVQAGRELNKEYNIPKDQRNTLIYVFKVGDQKVTGKLIGLK